MANVRPSSAALTDLILTLFRVNNAALVWGDRLVGPFGLTSARWQVLGAIAFADSPQPVAWLARDLGSNRQNVQRIVNELVAEGVLSFAPNPQHRRAQLVLMTAAGREAYAKAVGAWYPAAEALAEDLTAGDLEIALRVLTTLRGRLGAQASSEDGSGSGGSKPTG